MLGSESKTNEQQQQQLLDDAVLYLQDISIEMTVQRMRKDASVIKIRSLCYKMVTCCIQNKGLPVDTCIHIATVHTYIHTHAHISL